MQLKGDTMFERQETGPCIECTLSHLFQTILHEVGICICYIHNGTEVQRKLLFQTTEETSSTDVN